MKKQTVTAAVRQFGGPIAFALIFNVSREAVRKWQAANSIPYEKAEWLRIISDGKFGPDNLIVSDNRWESDRVITKGMIDDRIRLLQSCVETFKSAAERLHLHSPA